MKRICIRRAPSFARMRPSNVAARPAGSSAESQPISFTPLAAACAGAANGRPAASSMIVSTKWRIAAH